MKKVWAVVMKTSQSIAELKQSQAKADAKWKQSQAEADARLEKMIQENQQAAEERARRYDKMIQESRQAAEERAHRYDKMIQENQQSAEKSTRRLKKVRVSLNGQQKDIKQILRENAEQQKKTDAQLAKTDRQLAKTDKQLGNLGNRLGEVIEHFITAGAIPRFNAMGYHFTKASTRVKIIDPKTERTRAEADVVLENGESVIIVEVKTEPSLSNVQHHIRRLQIFREDRDKSSPNDSKKIYGAIAAAVFPDEVQEAALSAGFYVIVQSGDSVKIAVPEGFVPTAF